MLHSISPVWGVFYVLVLFLLSFTCVIAVRYMLDYFHAKTRKETRSEQEKRPTPVYYVLQKHPKPRQKRTVKKRKAQPKRELYYLSTLQKQEESE